MSGHGLGGADGSPVRICLSKRQFEGVGFGGIVEVGSCTVCVDIEVLSLAVARFVESLPDCLCGRNAIRTRCGVVVGVAGAAVTANLGDDFGSAGLGVLIFLEHHQAGSFRHYESAPAPVERQAGLAWILFGSKGPAVGKTSDGERGHCGLAATGKYCVSPAIFYGKIGLTYGIGSCRASGYVGQARALGLVLDGYVSAGDVRYHHRNEKR